MRRPLVWLVVGLAAAGAWRAGTWMTSPPGARSGTSHLVNQVWIDHMPRHERDLVGHLLIIDDDDFRFGIAGHSSRWRTTIDAFVWGLDGDLLRTRFPQDEKKAAFRVRTWSCKGEAPAPFELCLELRHGTRSVRLFSRRDWVIEPRQRSIAAGDVAWLAAGLPARDRVAASVEATGKPAPDGWLPLD